MSRMPDKVLGTWLGAVVVGSLALSTTAFVALRWVIAGQERLVSDLARDLVLAKRLSVMAAERSIHAHSFFVLGNSGAMRRLSDARASYDAAWRFAERHFVGDERPWLARVREAQERYHAALDDGIARKLAGAAAKEVRSHFEHEVVPRERALRRALRALVRHEERALEAAERSEASATDRLQILVGIVGAVSLFVAMGAALLWRRTRRVLDDQRQERERHLARIERSNRDLEAFAGRVAHDLRGMLTPLSLLSVQLQRSGLPPEKVAEAGQRVGRAVRRAMGLIEGLLAFSRAENVSQPGAAAAVRPVVEEVLEELGPVAEGTGAVVERDLCEATVACSPGLLQVVLRNLVGNAIKYVAGRERRRVRITARETDGSCELVVEDSGPGIPAEALGRIFEPFYRVPGTSAEGSGLGLATVQRIVGAHRGRIEVRSVPGEGSAFRVLLPLAPALAQR